MTPSVTQSNVMQALGDFLTSLALTGAPKAGTTTPTTVRIQQSQANRVAEPGVPDYVLMTPTMMVRLSTNRSAYSASAQTRTTTEAVQVTVQLDVYGPNAEDNAATIALLIRDVYACQSFAASPWDVQPLYAGDARQAAFTDAEQQYENRWTLDVVLQANVALTVAQQSALSVAAALAEVDTVYPPLVPVGEIALDQGGLLGVDTGSAVVITSPGPTPGLVASAP